MSDVFEIFKDNPTRSDLKAFTYVYTNLCFLSNLTFLWWMSTLSMESHSQFLLLNSEKALDFMINSEFFLSSYTCWNTLPKLY